MIDLTLFMEKAELILVFDAGLAWLIVDEVSSTFVWEGFPAMEWAAWGLDDFRVYGPRKQIPLSYPYF